MKVIPDFENELKVIDSRLAIVPNPNREELANIKLEGVDICPIPRYEILEESDPSYVIVTPNGWKMRHKSRSEALAQVQDTLEKIKTEEGRALFFTKDDE